jgi:hypothetical protein
MREAGANPRSTDTGITNLMMPLKSSNSTGIAMMIRPAHGFFFEAGAV